MREIWANCVLTICPLKPTSKIKENIMKIITKKQYEKNVKKLEEKYLKDTAYICEKYDISPLQYEMFAEIIANEKFKQEIREIAKEGGFVQGLDSNIELL